MSARLGCRPWSLIRSSTFMPASVSPISRISAEVIDPMTLVPLDKQTILNSVKKTGRLVVVHEAHRTAGWGAEVASMVAEEAFPYLDAPPVRLGTKACPLPFNVGLENAATPQVADIVEAARRVCYRK